MLYTRTSSRAIALATLATFALQLLSPLFEITFANNTAYYVDATGGSDANDGLGVGTAWQSLAYVTTQSFAPGDQILLKCGETWTDPLTIADSGISGSEIIIGSYGSCTASNKPILASTGATNITFSSGASYLTVSGLSFPAATATHIDLAL